MCERVKSVDGCWPVVEGKLDPIVVHNFWSMHSNIVVIKLSAVLCASFYDAAIKPPPQTLWLSRCCEGTPAGSAVRAHP